MQHAMQEIAYVVRGHSFTAQRCCRKEDSCSCLNLFARQHRYGRAQVNLLEVMKLLIPCDRVTAELGGGRGNT